MAATDSIKVAVRVRPLLAHEIANKNKQCLNVLHSISQVQIRGPGIEEAFTYNYVYGIKQNQEDVFNTSVKPLIHNLFKGYNVTVLAYGQTGSGKTYSMGTSCGTDGNNEDGVIPKSVKEIFSNIGKSNDSQYSVMVSFLELYNEQIRDLLLSSAGSVPSTSSLEVREDTSGNVCIPGLTQVEVKNITDTLSCLSKGSQYRSTGATAMNKTSSRSHAVFTITIERRPLNDEQATVAKFCLVDLAGSERAKKTQSTGDRFREGVNINMGLLALGNVISALGDETQRRNHIPYRDSKLTRLLQDSLGGNSYTLMIACVSPADSNISESLNTLRYADRALRIKNKPMVNADPNTAEIGVLKSKLLHITQLLTLERKKLSYRKCPPGHQRLIDLVRGELSREDESSFVLKVKSTSPTTKSYLRQVGIPLSEDEDDEEEILASNDVDNRSQTKSLFPQLEGLSPSSEEEEDHEDVAEMEDNYFKCQANLGSELEKVDLELEEKVALMSELNSAAEIEEKFMTLQHHVKELQQEKEGLESALFEMQKHNPKINANLAEQRRLMIKELERKIVVQKKQLADLTRLRQEKKRDTDRINNLSSEIQNLKQAKVRLTREIKKSADNYRSWKQRQDREVGRLQDAERKGRHQLDKQTKLHNRQQAVLQRKYQEAMASNKRMQAMLQRRTTNITVAGQKNAAEATEKLHTWIDNELGLERNLITTQDAYDEISVVVEKDTEKLKELKASICWEDRKSKQQRLTQARELTDRINLNKTQMTELEHKLIGAEINDAKSPHSRWAGVTNLADARVMLNYLFTMTVNTNTALKDRNDRVSELEDEISNLSKELEKRDNELKRLVEKEPKLSQSPANLMKPPVEYTTPKTLSQNMRSQAVTTVLKNRKMSLFANPGLSDDEEEDEEEEVDQTDKDPDWRLTPFVKELYARSKRSGSTGSDKNLNNSSSRCSCKGKCNTKRCSCVKNGGTCAENCSCVTQQCENRQQQQQVQDLNETFVLSSTLIDQGSMSSLKRESTETSKEDILDKEIPKKRRLFSQDSI